MMSAVMNRAPGIDTTDLKSIFTVNKSAVGVLVSHGYSTWSPPTVSWTLFGSSFCGQKSITIRPYVHVHPCGTSHFRMKKMVSVGILCPHLPCASPSTSLMKAFSYTSLYLGM